MTKRELIKAIDGTPFKKRLDYVASINDGMDDILWERLEKLDDDTAEMSVSALFTAIITRGCDEFDLSEILDRLEDNIDRLARGG